MNYKSIPKELRKTFGWVLIDSNKAPINPITKKRAKSNDPGTWSTHEYTVKNMKGYAGIAVGLDDRDVTVIDLDHCRDPKTGEIEPWAQKIVHDLSSYTEISMSGTGLHIVVKAKIWGDRNRQGQIEMYDKKRFMIMTGNHLQSTPMTIVERQAELDALYLETFGSTPSGKNSKDDGLTQPTSQDQKSDEQVLSDCLHSLNNSKFKALYDRGDWKNAGYRSQSEADMALCGMLSNSGASPEQTDRLYRRSKLMRKKWDSRRGDSTYGAQLLDKIFEEEEREVAPNLLRYKCNDAGNVERLIAMYGHVLRYCHELKSWLCWDGKHWAPDRKKYAHYLAKLMFGKYLDQAIREANEIHEKFAKSCLDVKRINSVLEMALADPKLIVDVSALDLHPYLLNLQNGTMDLRTGALRPHSRDDFLTQILDFDYDPNASCPQFLDFLDFIFDGNQELIKWLQKAAGYSLTGVTTEKVMLLCLGGGDNGKTTLLSLIRQILGPYAGRLLVETLMSQKNKSSGGPQPDLADLRAKRFIMTSETEEDRWLDEQQVKQLTQGIEGATIKARNLYQDYIEFFETYKIWMDANHRPEIRGRDNAIWNRLCLIPFNITIPYEKRDKHFAKRLMKEAPDILAWMVKGAVRWHKEGLGKPPEIEEAVQEWRDESDSFKDFIAEKCVLDPHAETFPMELRKEYEEWCRDEGCYPLGSKKYAIRLRELGCGPGKDKKGVRIWRGIKLISSRFDGIRNGKKMY